MKSLNSFINEAGRGRPKKEVNMDAIDGKPAKNEYRKYHYTYS